MGHTILCDMFCSGAQIERTCFSQRVAYAFGREFLLPFAESTWIEKRNAKTVPARIAKDDLSPRVL